MGYYIVIIDEINIKLKRFSGKPAIQMLVLLRLGESKQKYFNTWK